MKRFKFTLLAAVYSGGGIEVTKPFELILPADDPRIEFFRNPSFKEVSVDGSGVPVVSERKVPVIGNPPKSTSPPQQGHSEEDPEIDAILEYEGINKAHIVKLKGATYFHVKTVLDEADPIDALCSIDGIGEAMAEKILAACQAVGDKE